MKKTGNMKRLILCKTPYREKICTMTKFGSAAEIGNMKKTGNMKRLILCKTPYRNKSCIMTKPGSKNSPGLYWWMNNNVKRIFFAFKISRPN